MQLVESRRRDKSIKAIEILTKDVEKLRSQCDFLNKERESRLE